MLALLKEHPEGISEGQMRAALRIRADEQTQFGRRRRDLHYYYHIDKKRVGKEVLYVYRGPLRALRDASPTNTRLRAQVLRSAHGRCGSAAGRSISMASLWWWIIIPREWGGATEPENLWAICEECNHGKKNLFASVDSEAMRSAVRHDSVHVRI